MSEPAAVKVVYSVVLPRRVVPQPVPHLFTGGDCGPCVLAGLLETTPAWVYAELQGKIEPLTYYEMQHCLAKALHVWRRLDRVVDHFPIGWPVYEEWRAFGNPAHRQATDWFNHVRMAVDAGCYGIAAVDTQMGGPAGEGSNHWVMICGVRELIVPTSYEVDGKTYYAGRYDQQILVSCSAKNTPDEEWVDVHDFLKVRGGFNLLFARPSAGDPR